MRAHLRLSPLSVLSVTSMRFPWAHPFSFPLSPGLPQSFFPPNDFPLESPCCLEALTLHGWPLLSLLPLASLLLPTPFPLMRAEDKWNQAVETERARLPFFWHLLSPPSVLGRGSWSPGRKQRIQSKLALNQHSARVTLVRNWAKFGQKPTQNPALEYASIPHLSTFP